MPGQLQKARLSRLTSLCNMAYVFHAYGHENILATHKNTLEFTKDADVSKNGDCILGVLADFDTQEIRQLLTAPTIQMSIMLDGTDKKFVISGQSSKTFCSKHEIVLRRGEFLSDRTLMVRVDKVCNDIPREFVQLVQSPSQRMTIWVGAHGKKAAE